jgi:hypothetical protein
MIDMPTNGSRNIIVGGESGRRDFDNVFHKLTAPLYILSLI